MYRKWSGMLLLGACVVGVSPAPRTSADDKSPRARGEKLPADLAFVFESGSSFVTLRPDDLLDAAPLKQLPPRLQKELERIATETQKHLGIPVGDMERVSILFPGEPMLGPVAVVRTRKAYDHDAVLRTTVGEGFRQEKYKGYSLFTPKGRDDLSLCAIDGQTFGVGNARGLKDAITCADGRSTSRPHGVAVEWAAAKHQVVVGATAEPLLGMMMMWCGVSVRTPYGLPFVTPDIRKEPSTGVSGGIEKKSSPSSTLWGCVSLINKDLRREFTLQLFAFYTTENSSYPVVLQ